VLGLSNAEVIEVLAKEFGVQVKSHSSTVDQDVADKAIARLKAGKSGAAPAKQASSEPKAAQQAPPKAPQGPSQGPSTEKLPEQPAAAAEQRSPQPQKPAAPQQPPRQESMGAQAGARPADGKEIPREQRPSGTGVPSQGEQHRPAPRPGQPGGSYPSQQRPGQPGGSYGGPQRPGQPGGSYPSQQRPGQPGGSYGGPQRPGQPGGSYGGQQRPGQPGGSYGGPQRPGQPGGSYGGQQRPGQPGGSYGGPQRPGQPGGSYGGPQRPGQPGGSPGGPRPTHQRSRHSEKSIPRHKREEEQAAIQTQPKVVSIDEPIVVRDLAEKLEMRETEIIKHLFMKGMMVTVNQTLDVDFAKILAKELGCEVEETKAVKHEGEYSHLDSEGKKKLDEALFKHLEHRAPVVSIMGHVDHGKTTLLDSIRESRLKVVDSEAGGITQSIGAYTVERNDQRIVFLDTPGHEAFTSMRMRGAKSTDIAILVVAADDGVMPQTIEAINHAKAAKIPIIIAVNKIDKADADPDHVLVQLAEHGLSAEKWGGDTLTCEVSALQKLGLDDLLDSILLVSELLELKADSTVPAEGVIIEAQLDKRMGPVATALVQNGTLKVGDNVLIGAVGGRVRALISDIGERILTAGPATPVEILGLDGVPNAGDTFRVINNDKLFKQELASEKQRHRDERIGVTRASVAGFSGRSETDTEARESQFNLLVKADTQGSLEAVVDVLQRMTSDEIKINIVHSATGDVTEADVMLASTANALIISFNSQATGNAERLAEQQGAIIKRYDVIYHITDEIEKWVLGQLAPETEEVQIGSAEVRQIFKVGKTGIIAGCMVTNGKIVRSAKSIVLRDGKEVFSGPLSNLKRFKDDVKEVAAGYECGISFDRYNDLQEGDVIEVYTVKALERTSL
jgi:translation initiation factor IF-2